MKYSNICSRAGLVATIFALTISLVSAVPIPTPESGLSSTLSLRSNPSLNGQPGVDTARILSSGRMSTSATRAHTRRPGQDISTNMDDQLVRRSVASKIRNDFKKAGHAIAHVAQKVGNGIKTAAKKVETFAKNQGAKIAKFGLKVVESVGEVAGHVASFIPAVGKPIQQAIHGVSTVAGVVSDHIHAKLSNKLEKGMKIMNKADKVMSFIPRDFSEDEIFLQRDISEGYSSYFEERDDLTLENREESYFEAIERDIYERYDLD